MKNILFGLVVLMLLAVGCNGETLGSRKADVTEFKALAEAGEGIVLDVRTPGEVADGTIGDASVIDFHSDDFRKKLSLISRDKPIYVFCRSGGRSGQAAKLMSEMGFAEVVDLKGGIGAWKQAGYPVTESAAGSGNKGAKLEKELVDSTLTGSAPVLLAFQTEWCTPCRAMKPILDQFEKTNSESVRLLRIDMDANEELAERFGVTGVPVFLGLKEGKEIWRASGVLRLEELKAGIGL